MHYLRRINQDLDRMRQAVEVYDEGINDLVRYLTSEKFKLDPTVQVRDVLNRIDAARFAVTDKLDELSQKCTWPGQKER